MSLNNIVHQNSLLESVILNLIENQENNVEFATTQIIQTVFETLLVAERNIFLKNSENNKGNGYYSRIAKTLSGKFRLNIPRDRMGLFKPLILEIIKEEKQNFDNLAFRLYSKGLSIRDINDVLEDTYGINTSPQYVSNVTEEYLEVRKQWQERKLDKEFIAIYIDAIHVNIRRNKLVDNEAVYVAVGLKPDLTREILGIYSIPEESASGWRDALLDLKTRGVKKILIIIADGLKGLENAVEEVYSKSKFQKCIVHLKRNIGYKVRAKDRNEIMTDLKTVFNLDDSLDTKEKAMTRMEIFLDKWKHVYPALVKMDIGEYHFNYLLMPFEIRRMIYTTNWIERLNKEIRKVIKNKNSFPNHESALSLIWMKIMDFESRVYKYQITSLCSIQERLKEMF
jgi:transposase-like protein